MKIFIEKDNITKNIEHKGSVEELLNKLNINPIEVIIINSKNKIITKEQDISLEDSIKIISVVSGG